MDDWEPLKHIEVLELGSFCMCLMVFDGNFLEFYMFFYRFLLVFGSFLIIFYFKTFKKGFAYIGFVLLWLLGISRAV